MNIGGLIVAAGLSSRMGAFKPLLPLNGFPMAEMTVNSMKNAGIRDIVVVTGFRADELETALTDTGVRFVRNREYVSTDMLESVKIGLAALGDCDAFFLLPGDMPLVAPSTFCALRTAAQSNPDGVCYPVCKNARAHPPLIARACFDGILSFSGDGGLRAALAAFPATEVPVNDPGALLDADVRNDFAKLAAAARATKGLSVAECEKLHQEADIHPRVLAHCRAVSALAAHMAEQLIQSGRCLDIELCRSGGLLHDIMRLEPYHGVAGAKFMEARGYHALAGIVRVHNSFSYADDPELDETGVVTLADKLLIDDIRVPLAERYGEALKKFADNKEIFDRIEVDARVAQAMLEKYEVITGDKL